MDDSVLLLLVNVVLFFKIILTWPFLWFFDNKSAQGVLCPACSEFAPNAVSKWFADGYREYLLRRQRRYLIRQGIVILLVISFLVVACYAIAWSLKSLGDGFPDQPWAQQCSRFIELFPMIAIATPLIAIAILSVYSLLGRQEYQTMAKLFDKLSDHEMKTVVIMEYNKNGQVLGQGKQDVSWLRKFVEMGPSGRAGLANGIFQQDRLLHPVLRCPHCNVSSCGLNEMVFPKNKAKPALSYACHACKKLFPK